MKAIRDGKVGVLVSEGGHGGGWSTWNKRSLELMFDATIVLAVEQKLPFVSVEEYLTNKYPDSYLSRNAYAQLEVYWLDEGTQFVIDEDNGLETLRLCYETDWIIASIDSGLDINCNEQVLRDIMKALFIHEAECKEELRDIDRKINAINELLGGI